MSRTVPGEPHSDEFRVEAETTGSHAVVTVVGEIDAYTAPALRSKLLELAGSGVERVVIDLRRVEFIESVGLGTLVAARKRMHAGDKTICLVVGEDQRRVRTPLEITRLDHVFPIHATLDAAVKDCLSETAA